MRGLPAMLNSLFRRTPAAPKVFFIGFNKCGTKTFHNYFRANGYASIHCRSRFSKLFGGPTLAEIMEANVKRGRDPVQGLQAYSVFSDMIFVDNTRFIEANSYFRELHKAHPTAYFIFNDRPVEKWLASRRNHEDGPYGSLLGRFRKSSGLSESGALRSWREQYELHKSAVLTHFSDVENFLYFHIEEHSATELNAFLSKHFKLSETLWSHRGSDIERRSKYGG
jgi:Sulfotransferase domain